MTRCVCSNLLRRTVNSYTALFTDLELEAKRKRTYEVQHSKGNNDISSGGPTEPDNSPAIEEVQLGYICKSWDLKRQGVLLAMVYRD
jgi:hypothetical protein